MQDAVRLDALGAAFLVDLRHPDECAARPNRWAPAQVLARPAEPAGDSTPRPTSVVSPEYSAPIARGIMQATYARIPFDAWFITLFGEALRLLAETGGPMVVHCSVGKDRTGIACAVLLETLGVDPDDILRDFLATNVLMDRTERARLVRADLEPMYGALDDATIEPVIGVEASYLEAALAAIKARDVSVAAYVEQTLGVSPGTQARLRAVLAD